MRHRIQLDSLIAHPCARFHEPLGFGQLPLAARHPPEVDRRPHRNVKAPLGQGGHALRKLQNMPQLGAHRHRPSRAGRVRKSAKLRIAVIVGKNGVERLHPRKSAVRRDPGGALIRGVQSDAHGQPHLGFLKGVPSVGSPGEGSPEQKTEAKNSPGQ